MTGRRRQGRRCSREGPPRAVRWRRGASARLEQRPTVSATPAFGIADLDGGASTSPGGRIRRPAASGFGWGDLRPQQSVPLSGPPEGDGGSLRTSGSISRGHSLAPRPRRRSAAGASPSRAAVRDRPSIRISSARRTRSLGMAAVTIVTSQPGRLAAARRRCSTWSLRLGCGRSSGRRLRAEGGLRRAYPLRWGLRGHVTVQNATLVRRSWRAPSRCGGLPGDRMPRRPAPPAARQGRQRARGPGGGATRSGDEGRAAMDAPAPPSSSRPPPRRTHRPPACRRRWSPSTGRVLGPGEPGGRGELHQPPVRRPAEAALQGAAPQGPTGCEQVPSTRRSRSAPTREGGLPRWALAVDLRVPARGTGRTRWARDGTSEAGDGDVAGGLLGLPVERGLASRLLRR